MKEDRSWSEIDLDNFEHNLCELKKFIPAGTAFMQIVKADAYGHGAYEIARKAIACGAAFLGVANVQEGLLLRHQGINIPILILSPSLEEEIYLILEYQLTPTVSDVAFAEQLNRKAKNPVPVHVNIDTGMGRSGFRYEFADHLFQKLQGLEHIILEGVFSHFSAAENDDEYTKLQSERFEKAIFCLASRPQYLHIANSSGVIALDCPYANLVRLGLLSYGIYADASQKSKLQLLPVMTFKSHIGQIKQADAGDFIGYNKTYKVTERTIYAIIPVGYADGYDFLLSNRGKVLINNQICPVIGKISMDMTAVDISHIDCEVGDEVVLLGGNEAQISADNLTALYGGSSYELLCQIGRRAKRYYFQNGELIASSPLLRRDFVSLDYSDDKLNKVIETAIEQRLQSKEIAELIYSDLLKHFFAEHDRDIHYRKQFRHKITFQKHRRQDLADYFLVETTLTFTKKLQNDYFVVASDNNEKQLEKYFLQPDVEYRWVIDNKLAASLFEVTSVTVNNINLQTETKLSDGCLEIRCSHSELKNLKDREVEFSISTQTFYHQNSHQLTVYLIEMTKGAEITFQYGNLFPKVETVQIFSGRSKFTEITRNKGSVTISFPQDEWIFPTSGVVFAY
ncbi:MAG TPA: alanine racemase [Candidatus Cloacimonadota bacterium]|nr:alanine racemase [Candidatus Cloacimonadota bacterium]